MEDADKLRPPISEAGIAATDERLLSSGVLAATGGTGLKGGGTEEEIETGATKLLFTEVLKFVSVMRLFVFVLK